MKQWIFGTSTAFAALMIGHAALADVTPEEVWQSWQEMGAAMGQTTTAESAVRDGDTLVVTNMSVAVDDGNGMTVNGTVPEITFTDNGDGTVDVMMADSYGLTMTTPATEGIDGSTPTTLDILIEQPGMVMTASGTPEAMSYDLTAPEMTVSLAATPDGAETAEMVVAIALTNVAGGYLLGGDDTATTLESGLTAEAMAITGEGTDSVTGDVVTFEAAMADVAIDQTGNFLGAEAMANMAQALKDGFAMDGSLRFAAMTFDLDVTSAGVPAKVSTMADSGEFGFAMNVDGLEYGISTTGTAVTMSGGDMPFPELKIAYDEATFSLGMPVTASDTPSDFGVLTKLVNFTISDEVWAMVDPTSQLPRDPATVVLAMQGTGSLTVDLLDEAAMAAAGGNPPATLNSLDITEMRASVGGAELTGMGGFTFDNTDMTTFQGVPAPTGKIDLKLVGGNTLLDKLAAMGLVPADQVGMIRMMSGMFVVPSTDGSDSMTSTIEFKDKAMLVNGNAIPM